MNQILGLMFFFCCSCLCAQQIVLDENFEDWNTGVTTFFDKKNDGSASGVDFAQISMSNDETFLYLYIDLSKEINLQNEQNVTVYLDLDDNVSTGIFKNGIGAELMYNLGERSGRIYRASNSVPVFHDELGLITSPTHTSSKFEMSILRNISHGLGQTTMAKTIKVVWVDDVFNGDRAPDDALGYRFTFDEEKKFEPLPFSLEKNMPDQVRFMSYNVLRDNLFSPSLQPEFKRIFKAIDPQIIGLCEIYDHSSEETAEIIDTYLPSLGSQRWYHSEVNPDIKLVSRYPIIDTRPINGNGAFLLDLGETSLVFIVCHLACCDNDAQRQDEVDDIMAFVRSIKFGISPFSVTAKTPIVIAGDMNFVGFKRQLETYLTGNIVNNAQNGPDFSPDWDATDLEDAKPITTNMPAAFTWYNKSGSYSAGRLDFVIYTGSVLQNQNCYTLWTEKLTQEQLNTSGLQKNDVSRASDHLPQVVDFSFIKKTDVTEIQPLKKEDFKYVVVDRTLIVQTSYDGKWSLLDLTGKTIFEGRIKVGHDEMVDVSDLTSGIYLLQFKSENKIQSLKLLLP